MNPENYTRIGDVWLVGVQYSEATRIPLFIFFLMIYITIVISNCLIIYLVLSSSCLHSPMYYFLCSLSFCEIIFTTNLKPVLLISLLKGGASMHLTNCIVQWYICASLAATECFLLAVMSYDRYIAICNPLHYHFTMTLKKCLQLVTYSWIGGFTCLLATLVLIFHLDFCGPQVIDHYFCDFSPLLELSCSDYYFVKTETIFFCFSVTIFPLTFVIGTYVCIILAILKIPSSIGRQKTFSTCSSHLSIVCTYYGTLISLYVVPRRGLSSTNNKILSLIYTVVTPLFNPIIYSLRNREIRTSLHRLLVGVKKEKN
ncbi:hypothetical protein GDO86_001808 [Hymenochirus boettgeri]|uniref:Olfactory receptor n=1 Tax=Hymenochirus boettgeri TaxID=247094 RepID=A0A8T2KN14_9PIPI|nr:hypothetical protein GDO86_001808 [Hymenochirus boettgeri]